MLINTKRINEIKLEKGLTNVMIAKKAGFGKARVSILLKRGWAEPITIHKLAKGLGVDVYEILLMED